MPPSFESMFERSNDQPFLEVSADLKVEVESEQKLHEAASVIS
jgi:hypothetical protein